LSFGVVRPDRAGRDGHRCGGGRGHRRRPGLTGTTETIRTNEKFAANMMNRIHLTGQVMPVDGGMVM